MKERKFLMKIIFLCLALLLSAGFFAGGARADNVAGNSGSAWTSYQSPTDGLMHNAGDTWIVADDGNYVNFAFPDGDPGTVAVNSVTPVVTINQDQTQISNSLHVNDDPITGYYATFWVDRDYGQSVAGEAFYQDSFYTYKTNFGAATTHFNANSYYQDSSESFSSELNVYGWSGIEMGHGDESTYNYAQLSLTTNPNAYGSGYGEGAYIGYWNYEDDRDFGTLAKPDSVSIGRWQWVYDYDLDEDVIESFNGITITDTDTTITGATYMDSDGTGTAGSTFSLTNDGASLLSSTGHGLTIGADSTTLSGGTSSSEWILADGQADLSVDGTQVFVATNSGTATDIKISSDTLTVGAATTINNTLDVTGLTTTAGISNTGNLSSRSTNTSFGLDVNDTVAQLGYQSGTLTNGVQATAGGLVLSSTNTAAYSSTVRLDGSQAYISYNDGTFESGLEAGPAGLIVGSSAGATSLGMTTNISTNEVIVGYMSGTQAYGLHADNDEVNVGYLNGTDDFHGLTVTNSQTTLSGGTNSSSLTLADNVATLAVGTATEGEIDLLTATNNGGGATNVTIGNTANNYLEVDSTTGTTVHGNLTITGVLTVNGVTFTNTGINNTGNIATDTLTTTGLATLNSLAVNNNAAIGGALDVTGTATMNGIDNDGDITNTGNIQTATLTVDSDATIGRTLDVTGATTLGGTLEVAGTTTLNGATTINNTLDVADDLTATGTTNTIGTAGVSTNTITGVGNFITATNSNTMGVTGGSAVTTTATRVTALTADGSGLTINNGGTVALKNSVGNDGYGPGHGLTIHPDNTVLSGGTTSTTLTLNNTGAAFANTATGGPARVTGVADGVYPYDAVNVSQLNGLKKDIERAYAGVASISALSAIPATAAGKRFAIGAGYGYFEGENAIAIGVKARLGENFNIQAGVGVGVDNLKDSTYSANAGFSFSF